MRPNSRRESWILLITALAGLAGACTAATAAEPPALLNYEGVLRDPSGAPQEGDFDMIFRFFDAAVLGNEILIDGHVATGTGQVKVKGGLFNVHLGSGEVIDGAAVLPNDPYTSLAQVFRDFSPVYLEIEVRGETLNPRIKVVATAYALNADHLDGKDASEYLDTSSMPQTKSGNLEVAGALKVGGQVTIQGGAPGAGRVLTSSATGLAAWQDLPAVQINQLGALADRLGSPDPSELPFAALRNFDCSGGNTATLSFTAGGATPGTVVGFVGADRISSTYEYYISIERGDTTLNQEAQIGLDGRLTLQRVGGTTTFSGLITEFGLAGWANGVATYVARMEPHLVTLARSSGYESFADSKASDIFFSVLGSAGISAGVDTTSHVYELALRYEESPLDFLNRLAEGEGLHYHFAEDATTEKLFVRLTNAGFTTIPGSFNYYGDLQDPGTGEEFIATFHERTRLFTGDGTAGGWNYLAKNTVVRNDSVPGGVGEFQEFFADASSGALAQAHAESIAGREQVRRLERTGSSNVAALKAGHLFTLSDLTAAGIGGSYLVTEIHHYALNDPAQTCVSYGNVFSALPSAVEYEPPRRAHPPNVRGPVRAIVTNVQDPDGLGRVKVKFVGDLTSPTPHESAWARVVQAGHWQDTRRLLPAVDDEVLVDFVRGDPMVPIVVGRLDNGVDVPSHDADFYMIRNPQNPGGGGPCDPANPGSSDPCLQNIYFFDDSQPDNESLSWDDPADRFEFSNDLLVNGTIESLGSMAVGSSLTVGGSITGGSSLTVSGLVSANGGVQGDTLAAQGAIDGGSTLTLPGPITLNGANISQTAGNFSFGGSVSASGNLSSTGDLTVGGGDILATVLRIAPTSTLSLSGSLVMISGIESRTSSNTFVRTMIDDDNNSVTSTAEWHHNGSLANLNKLADLQESGNFRVRGSLTPFVSFDLAESFRASEPVEAGDLVSLDPASAGAIRLTTGAADPMVIGVVSENPGIILGGGAFDAAALRSAWGDEVGALYEEDRARLRDAVLAEGEDLRRELDAIRAASHAKTDVESTDDPKAAGESGAAVRDSDGAEEIEARQVVEERIDARSLELFYQERFAPVALAGRVPVKADASFGAIRPGDTLTPSPVPGVAMRASGPVPIIGTALEGLPGGRGKVLTLVHRGPSASPAATDAAGTARGIPAPETTPEASRASASGTEPSSSPASLVAGPRQTPFTIHRTGGTTDAPAPEVFRIDDEGNVYARGGFQPASMDLAEYFPLSEPVEAGDVLVVDPDHPGRYRRGRTWQDPAVVGIVSDEPGVLLGAGIARIAAADDQLAAELEQARFIGDRQRETEIWSALEERFKESYAPVALSGTVLCKVDAGFGAIVPGDLLTTSSTPGHARRADAAAPGTIVGKALKPLKHGSGKIRVLVMLR